jgi:hypothetical protein
MTAPERRRVLGNGQVELHELAERFVAELIVNAETMNATASSVTITTAVSVTLGAVRAATLHAGVEVRIRVGRGRGHDAEHPRSADVNASRATDPHRPPRTEVDAVAPG